LNSFFAITVMTNHHTNNSYEPQMEGALKSPLRHTA